MTLSEENAFRAAMDWLRFKPFSRSGLIRRLEHDGYPSADAIYAVDHITVDWDMQALAGARDWLEFKPCSRNELIEHLKYEGFTTEQAEYGVTAVGYGPDHAADRAGVAGDDGLRWESLRRDLNGIVRCGAKACTHAKNTWYHILRVDPEHEECDLYLVDNDGVVEECVGRYENTELAQLAAFMHDIQHA